MGAEAEKTRESENSSTNPSPSPITTAQFAAWKRQKDADASARKDAAARKRAEDIEAGVAQMNGRELFEREPWVFDNTLY